MKRSKYRSRGYWKNWNNVKKELEEIINELGHFPRFKELNEVGRSSLNIGMKNFGGARKVREILGYDQKTKPSGSWQNLEFTLKEARQAIKNENWDKLPRHDILIKYGYSSLSIAIVRYHGGFRKFRELLGEKQNMIENGRLKNLEYCISQMKKIMQDNNLSKMPGQKKLRELRYSILSTAISKHHGGLYEFRRLLGEDHKVVKRNSWKSLEFTLEKTKEFFTEHPEYETLPNNYILRQLGYSSLGSAISNNHGGFYRFRKLLCQEPLILERGLWQKLEFALTEARRIMGVENWEKLPRQDILRKYGYSALSVAIHKYHGGFPVFRETLRQHMNGKSSKEELEDLLESYAGEN